MTKESQSPDVDEVLRTFLFSQLSDSFVVVYRCVASLDYPILDKHSLKQQLEDRSDKEVNRAAFQHILSILQPVDFRLDTPQGALEKISQRLGGRFQAWEEKANQVDQQLTAVLRTLKDLRRVGVGGSDLGAS